MELINEKKKTYKHSLIHFWKLINSLISKSFVFFRNGKRKNNKNEMKWDKNFMIPFRRRRKKKKKKKKNWMWLKKTELNIFACFFFWMKLLFNSILYGNFHIFIYGFFLSNTHTSIYRFSMKSFWHPSHTIVIYTVFFVVIIIIIIYMNVIAASKIV